LPIHQPGTGYSLWLNRSRGSASRAATISGPDNPAATCVQGMTSSVTLPEETAVIVEKILLEANFFSNLLPSSAKMNQNELT
jgi:hypothetical protein